MSQPRRQNSDIATIADVATYIRQIPKEQFEGFFHAYAAKILPTMGRYAAQEYIDDIYHSNIHFSIDMLSDFYHTRVNDCINATSYSRGIWLKGFKNLLSAYITTTTGIATELLSVIEI
jgi:hypothetical protein